MKTAANLTPTQVKVLQVLAKFPDGITRTSIEDKTDLNVGTDIIGPVFAEDVHNYPESLYGLGYAVPNSGEDAILRWYITSEGKKVAERMRTRDASSAVIPGDILDPVVVAFRPTRTYGIELYTVEDLVEIRRMCGAEYAKVSPDALRQQITNRRKMGKYKVVKVVPEWYTIYRQGQHWTALVEEMTEHNGCVINPAHKEGVSVYHRRFYRGGESVINQETAKDLIVLCEGCRKKLMGNLPEVPHKMPQTD